MNGTQKGEVRYCYDRQTWVRWNGETWTVESCAHPRKMPGCYACENAGMTIGKEIEEQEKPECPGHPGGPFDYPMGVSVYCDGSCIR